MFEVKDGGASRSEGAPAWARRSARALGVVVALGLAGACTIRTEVNGDGTSDAAAEAGSTGDASTGDASGGDASPRTLRFATYNTSLYRASAGALVTELATGKSESATRIATLLRRVRPDVLLLNEFDYDEKGEAARLFHDLYLVGDGIEGEKLPLDYYYAAPSNTGVPSGFDLDRSGAVGTTPGTREYGNDCLGFGVFPGQYGFVVFSRYPIDKSKIRTFQKFLWKDMPNAKLPDFGATAEPADWFSADALNVVRLSSKNHADVPIVVGDNLFHVLASHPTPPGFDGPEARNDKRNHDELRLWADYIDPARSGYLKDDDGNAGGLAEGAHFVIAGDLNSDPMDGETSDARGVNQLLEHPLVNGSFTPTSEGGPAAAKAQGGANATHVGNPAHDTADFSDTKVGNLRADYALPSKTLSVQGGAVVWPAAGDPLEPLVSDLSDHHLVWIDVGFP